MNKLSKYAPAIVRIGMGLVFIYFGTNQLMHPSSWTGFVPVAIPSLLGMSTIKFVLMNGWFEIVAGCCLLVGFQVRAVGLLLGLHLIGISLSIGFTALGVRDLGLSAATISIFFAGADAWCVDGWFAKRIEAEAVAVSQ